VVTEVLGGEVITVVGGVIGLVGGFVRIVVVMEVVGEEVIRVVGWVKGVIGGLVRGVVVKGVVGGEVVGREVVGGEGLILTHTCVQYSPLDFHWKVIACLVVVGVVVVVVFLSVIAVVGD
jgi:hypothetical protein